jgi:hypothetical protein
MKRRTFITGAFATTAALALGVSLYRPELVPEDSGDKAHALLFAVLLPVLLEDALPDVPVLREAAINRTIEAMHDTMSLLSDEKQAELTELLQMLESRLGLLLLTGSMTPLMLRSTDELVAMLEHWRHHYLAMLNLAYQGLRELVMAGFYSSPEHWSRLNYAKPDLFGTNPV